MYRSYTEDGFAEIRVSRGKPDIWKLTHGSTSIFRGNAIDKLANYERAEAEGRIVIVEREDDSG